MNKVLRMLCRFYATNAPIFLQRRKYTERARVAYDTLVDGRQKSHIHCEKKSSKPHKLLRTLVKVDF